MQFQLDDKACFNPRFVMMISDLWNNDGRILLRQNYIYKSKYSVYQSKDPLLDIRLTYTLGLDHYEIDAAFMGIQIGTTRELFDDTNKAINDHIRKIYEKYTTIGALEHPIYQMLECYLVGKFSQTTLSWRNISINITDNKFTLTFDNETFTDKFECNSKMYVRQLMQAMRDNTAPKIFYAGLPIERIKSARN